MYVILQTAEGIVYRSSKQRSTDVGYIGVCQNESNDGKLAFEAILAIWRLTGWQQWKYWKQQWMEYAEKTIDKIKYWMKKSKH